MWQSWKTVYFSCRAFIHKILFVLARAYLVLIRWRHQWLRRLVRSSPSPAAARSSRLWRNSTRGRFGLRRRPRKWWVFTYFSARLSWTWRFVAKWGRSQMWSSYAKCFDPKWSSVSVHLGISLRLISIEVSFLAESNVRMWTLNFRTSCTQCVGTCGQRQYFVSLVRRDLQSAPWAHPSFWRPRATARVPMCAVRSALCVGPPVAPSCPNHSRRALRNVFSCKNAAVHLPPIRVHWYYHGSRLQPGCGLFQAVCCVFRVAPDIALWECGVEEPELIPRSKIYV